MSPAGYSGTPLARKLGIKAGHRLALVAAPEDFEATLAPLPEGVRVLRRLPPASGRPCDVIVFFCRRRALLERRFGTLARRLVDNGGLWIGWPKKSSGVATDLAFDPVQRVGLDAGLVDNKVCAIDEVWSGLRFVYRLQDRKR